MIKGSNLVLRFLLELFALGALGYWGFKTGGGTVAKVGLGIGAPPVAAVVWGVFLSPRAAVPLPGFLILMLQVVVFGPAAAGLVATGHRTLALVFGAIVMINAVLMYAWGQRNLPASCGAPMLSDLMRICSPSGDLQVSLC